MSAPTLRELLEELQAKGVPLTDEQSAYLQEGTGESKGMDEDINTPPQFAIPLPKEGWKQIPGTNVWVATRNKDRVGVIHYRVSLFKPHTPLR